MEERLPKLVLHVELDVGMKHRSNAYRDDLVDYKFNEVRIELHGRVYGKMQTSSL